MHITINGERIGRDEYFKLMEMLYKDAQEIAGVYHGMNRSEKFRINWPDEYAFAEANWKTFVTAARAMYASRLADPNTPPADKHKMHLALILQAMASKGAQEKDVRLQLEPGTAQYEGDRAINRAILDQFGANPNFRAALANGAAKINMTRH
jgi:hypothetical protein